MVDATETEISPQEFLAEIGGWHGLLPEDAMIEQNGQQVRLRDLPDIQNAKDLSTLAKNYVESQREIGRRVRVPGKDAKPEELQGFKAKLYEAGVLQAPLASPQDYGITRPESIAEEMWNPELATNFASILHKYGIPKEAAPELLALHEQAINGAHNVLKVSLEQGMAALKSEFGDSFDERFNLASRLAPMIFKTPEELAFAEATGLANHPLFLAPLMRLAPLAQQDSSFMAGLQQTPGGAMTREEALAEHTRVMTDPKHEWHTAYKKGDPKALEYVDNLYKRAFSGAGV